MQVVSIREQPLLLATAIEYIQRKWATDKTRALYEDCLTHCISAQAPLPQWYLLIDGDLVVGCAGLIPNDFISRMDLYPWVCAVFVEKSHRGHRYGGLLLERAKEDARRTGFSHLYLGTDLVGYYERFGFSRVGTGWHPWGESSTIHACKLA